MDLRKKQLTRDQLKCLIVLLSCLIISGCNRKPVPDTPWMVVSLESRDDVLLNNKTISIESLKEELRENIDFYGTEFVLYIKTKPELKVSDLSDFCDTISSSGICRFCLLLSPVPDIISKDSSTGIFELPMPDAKVDTVVIKMDETFSPKRPLYHVIPMRTTFKRGDETNSETSERVTYSLSELENVLVSLRST